MLSNEQAQAQVCMWEECNLEGIKDSLSHKISAAQECAEVGLWLKNSLVHYYAVCHSLCLQTTILLFTIRLARGTKRLR